MFMSDGLCLVLLLVIQVIRLGRWETGRCRVRPSPGRGTHKLDRDARHVCINGQDNMIWIQVTLYMPAPAGTYISKQNLHVELVLFVNNQILKPPKWILCHVLCGNSFIVLLNIHSNLLLQNLSLYAYSLCRRSPAHCQVTTYLPTGRPGQGSALHQIWHLHTGS